MAESKNIWMWTAAALLCTTIGVSYLALNYQSQNARLQADYEGLLSDVEDLTVSNDLLIAQLIESQNAKLQAEYRAILPDVEDLTLGIIGLLVAQASESQNANLQAAYEALLADVEDLTINIDLLIDYGDGNVVWLNDTRVPLDVNFLKALELLAEIEYTTSEYGAFVTKVDGIGDDPTKYWLWFWYDTEAESWAYGPSAADFWVLHDGDVVSWEYTAP